MKKTFTLLLIFILVIMVITGCSHESKYEQNNDSFKVLENNISTGTAATHFSRLKKAKEIEGLGNVYEMASEKGNARVSIVENSDNVIELDVSIGDLKNQGDWATVVQVFALGLSKDVSEITEETTHDEVIKDVAKFLSNKLNEVFDSIDFKGGEKSGSKVENIGERRIVYTVNTSGNSISFNYLIDNRKLYEGKQ